MNVVRQSFLAFSAIALACGSARAEVTVFTAEADWQAAVGPVCSAGFEEFQGPVNTQYSWITFSDFNNGSPFAAVQFNHTGEQAMFSGEYPSGGGGGWAADFPVAVSGAALWTGDVQWPGSVVSLFDAQQTLLGTYDLFIDGGGNGPVVWGFIGFVSDAAPIARIEVAIDAADAVWFDDLQASGCTTTSVPQEPFAQRSWGQLKAVYR